MRNKYSKILFFLVSISFLCFSFAEAKGFLKTLKEGVDPVEGKFAEPGGYVTDHAFIKKGGNYHLFYIRGIAATDWQAYHLFNFGHAVSKDLKSWKIDLE